MAVKAQYTEQISAMVSEDMRKYLDAEAERRGVSLAVVVREMLDISRSRAVRRGVSLAVVVREMRDISRSRAEEIERPEKEAEG